VNSACSESAPLKRLSRARSTAVGGVSAKLPFPLKTAATVRPPTGVSRWRVPLARVKRARSRSSTSPLTVAIRSARGAIAITSA
jgi:hypothetical protein